MFNLITRLIDPSSGLIKLNGINIKDFCLNDLRSLISVVRQDGMVFDETILENIRFGKPTATDGEIREAAKMAYVDEFTNDLKYLVVRTIFNGNKSKFNQMMMNPHIIKMTIK